MGSWANIELNYNIGSQAIIKRRNNQMNDVNLSVILIFTILMFLIFHTPRVILSIYEAITIQYVLKCSQKRKGFYTIWYLYVQTTLQLVQAS